MTKLSTTLRTNAPYVAKSERYFSNIISATNTQDAVDSVVFSANNPQKPANLVPVAVNAAGSPYTMGSSDYVIIVDTTGGPVTINLNASATYGNLEREIVDGSANAATNNITIVPFGTEKFDGLAPLTIDTNAAGYRIRPLAAGWKVMP